MLYKWPQKIYFLNDILWFGKFLFVKGESFEIPSQPLVNKSLLAESGPNGCCVVKDHFPIHQPINRKLNFKKGSGKGISVFCLEKDNINEGWTVRGVTF